VPIKDKKIAKLDLYQPFERYLKKFKCNIIQIITRGTGKSYLLLTIAGRTFLYGETLLMLINAISD
jgi:hypothetical protein